MCVHIHDIKFAYDMLYILLYKYIQEESSSIKFSCMGTAANYGKPDVARVLVELNANVAATDKVALSRPRGVCNRTGELMWRQGWENKGRRPL